MDTNPLRTAEEPTDTPDDARQRTLAARHRIRRYFTREAVAESDPDFAEVIGGSAPLIRQIRRGG